MYKLYDDDDDAEIQLMVRQDLLSLMSFLSF